MCILGSFQSNGRGSGANRLVYRAGSAGLLEGSQKKGSQQSFVQQEPDMKRAKCKLGSFSKAMQQCDTPIGPHIGLSFCESLIIFRKYLPYNLIESINVCILINQIILNL